MRIILLASAALLSMLLFGTIAATTPVPPESSGDASGSGYGVYAVQVDQRL
jgi:hypothetical protein